MILHAGLFALDRRGVLVTGPPGAGKSDLALRALEAGFQLVADDRTLVWVSGGRLFGRAPSSIAGQIEARGLDIVRTTYLPLARIVLVAACVDELERLPEPQTEDILGLAVPRIEIRPLEASAPVKLRHAICILESAPKGRI